MTILPANVSDETAPTTETVGAAEATAEELRFRELFRLWLRDGHLHPLIHLIRQLRSKDPL